MRKRLKVFRIRSLGLMDYPTLYLATLMLR
jgi:hypothetical protein